MATGNDALPSRVGGRDEYSAFHELQNRPLHTYTVYIQDRINLQSLIHIPEEKRFLSSIAQITSPPVPPIRASCTTFFGRQKRRFSAYY